MEEGWLNRLKEAVEKDGRSWRAISRAAKAGPNYLGEVLAGKVPTIERFMRICEALDVSASYILTGVDLGAEDEEFLSVLADLSDEQHATLLSLARQLKEASRP